MAQWNRSGFDLKSLVELTEDQLGRLLVAVGEFRPSSAHGIGRDEAKELAAKTGLEEIVAVTALQLAYAIQARPTGVTENEVTATILEAGKEQGLEAAQVQSLLNRFKIPGNLQERVGRLAALSQGMPTFTDCYVACDLRLLRIDDQPQPTLVPIAIVRIGLDEGDDAVFQATTRNLERIRRMLDEALADLEKLGAITLPSREDDVSI